MEARITRSKAIRLKCLDCCGGTAWGMKRRAQKPILAANKSRVQDHHPKKKKAKLLRYVSFPTITKENKEVHT